MNDDRTITYVIGNKLDKEAFSGLVLSAKGDHRSLTEFAKECGVATSTLTRIVNRENTRASSVDLLRSIAQNAEVGSNVTFEQLLGANGYVAVEVKMSERQDNGHSVIGSIGRGIRTFINDLAYEDEEESVPDYEWERLTDNERAAYYAKTVKAIQKEDKKTTAAYREIILNEILSRGYGVTQIATKLNYFKARKKLPATDFDIGTDALPEGISDWTFHVRQIPNEYVYDEFYKLFFRIYCMQPQKRGVKYTILLSEKRVFDNLCDQLEIVHFRDPISVILVNLKTRRVVKEYIPPVENESWAKSIFSEEGKA